ncbi:poly(A) RNA polymerase gld-2 homolog A-like isoform X2 [Phymastichus coffea]|nr:poly(A) RNA polymerase gld-2 homolog A-like isoform X2 [Phymastichus coffea]
MVHVIGSYQSNGQYHPAMQNHGYYNGSPNHIHPDLIQINRNASNHSRHRNGQHGNYPLDLIHQFNTEAQNSNYTVHAINNWQHRLNSPLNGPSTPQRMNASHGLPVTPIQGKLNYRPMSAGSTKKQTWHNGNKLGKRHSYHDIPSHQESHNNSDSSVSSRSPTPNKHLKSSNTCTESSDDKDSLSSLPEQKYNKNKNFRYNNNYYRGNLAPSLSAGNLYQSQPNLREFPELTSRIATQNHQNRRKYNPVRISPTSQRLYRGKKIGGSMYTEVNALPKHVNFVKFSPVDKFLERSHMLQPKERPSNLLTGSVYDKLSKAIWEKFEQNQLTERTFCHKMYLWRYLFFFIKTKFPQYGLYLVGSTLNGFGTDNSDVDMCLLVKEMVYDQRTEAIYRLGQIMSCLRRSEYISGLELIQAKVPILKIRDNKYNLDVDLNYNNVVGIRNTHLLHCYSQIDWRVRPLGIVVKMWAQCQNINDARHMTISSYSLVLMVIHFLQCGISPPVLPCLHNLFKTKFHPLSDIFQIDTQEQLIIPKDAWQVQNMQTLGELLIEFFKYYDSFDFDQFAISIRVADKIPIETCRFVRSLKNDPHQWKHLCIEEPFDFTNTARSVYDLVVFQKIKDIFKETYKRLKENNDLSSIFTKIDIKD